MASKRRSLQTQARSAVIAGLALFVLAQVAMRLTIEEAHPEWRDPIFERKFQKMTWLLDETKPAPALVVSLGSSITVWGINAGKLESSLQAHVGRPVVAFNLANNGAGPMTQLLYTQRMLRRGIRPDAVVLELTPLNYGDAPTPHDALLHPAELLDRRDVEVVARHAPRVDLCSDWWQSFLVPVYGHRLALMNQVAPVMVPYTDRTEVWPDMDSHGWRHWDVPTPEQRASIVKHVQQEFHTRLCNYRIGQAHLQTLRELTELLERERIPTVMVLMPEGPAFRAIYADGAVTPLKQEFEAISRQHGFAFVSAREWFADEKFVDSYHLTHEGATELTERLSRQAVAQLLRPTANEHASR
jgi:hypothetical protein